MKDFDEWMEEHQTAWRRTGVSTAIHGTHNRVARSWIVPPAHWEEGLWPAIRSGSPNSLPEYLRQHKIQKHSGVHNLKSSWVACANLYFPFREHPEDRALVAAFLRNSVSDEIRSVENIELEYSESGALSPESLLGETGGRRGAGQTSPDVAFLANAGEGIVLTESKLTEHSFYDCSARTRKQSDRRPANPDPDRCLNIAAVLADPSAQCHQAKWGRRYWDRLRVSLNEDAVARLAACPAAIGGYQLFRQQALAEGYTRKYSLVFSAIAYDARNELLLRSLHSTGIDNVTVGWKTLLAGRSKFAAWTHQAWVTWVRRNHTGRWSAWLEWIDARYSFKAN